MFATMLQRLRLPFEDGTIVPLDRADNQNENYPFSTVVLPVSWQVSRPCQLLTEELWNLGLPKCAEGESGGRLLPGP